MKYFVLLFDEIILLMAFSARYFSIVSSVLLSASIAWSQNAAPSFGKAKALRDAYDFEASLNMCEALLKTADSTQIPAITKLATECENGLNMLDFTTSPTVIARKTVDIRDFYLHYSHLADNSWKTIPNDLAGEGGHPLCNAMHFDESMHKAVFPVKDTSGHWHLCQTRFVGDTAWTQPAPLGKAFLSEGDEIFPLLSADGTKLYFSSDALAGMGGYDIFVSLLAADGKNWGPPRNIGFPYSSPFNDFLYSDTPDGKYTLFASDRGCPEGKINIYVLAFENSPIRKSLGDLGEIRKTAALDPSDKKAADKGGSHSPASEGSKEFSEYFKAVRKLREAKGALEDCTSDSELFDLQAKFEEQAAKVRAMEDKMLCEGIVPPVVEDEKPLEPKASEPAARKYAFRKNSLGTLGLLPMEDPLPKIDYKFKVDKKTAVIVEGNLIPKGIVYQIQLCNVASKLTPVRLKGISPVFEVKQPNGKWTYYAGAFATYSEMTAALAKVKKLSFTQAFAVAWKDGRKIDVKTARAQESKLKK